MKLAANHFFTFIAIYAANADADIEQKQIKLIIKDSGKELYEEMRDLFDSLSDKDRLDLIQENNHFYNTKESKERLFQRMNDIFLVHGHANASESAVIRMLKHIL